jgi:hypothetical protein
MIARVAISHEETPMYALRAGLCCGALVLFASAVVADENSHRKAAEEM